MVKIEIKSEEVQEKEITVRATGEVIKLFSQVGWLQTHDEYPTKCEIPLGSARNRRAPYKAGLYTLSSDCIKIGNFGQIELNRFDFQLTMLPPLVLDALKRSEAVRAA